MKKGEKAVILILVIITIILIIIATVNKNSNKDNTNESNGSQSSTSESNVEVLDDGTKLNVNQTLNSNKTIEDGLVVSDIQLTSKDNGTMLLATITNTSSETKGGYLVDITFLAEDGSVLTTVGGLVPELEAGESTPLQASTTFDYADSYDFTITKK